MSQTERYSQVELAQKILRTLLSMSVLTGFVLNCQGEEKVVGSVLSVLSNTTISGYVNTGLHFSNTNVPARGFAGTWIGIATVRASTNRIELYFVVDESGNFAGRGMNYERTLGSNQVEGRLDRHGQAIMGQIRFRFHRNGMGTAVGRDQDGRAFSARLFRENIR